MSGMDSARCPLCNAANACVMARGNGGPCWCEDVDFNAELLARVPEPARDKVCICRQCVEKSLTSLRQP